MFTNFRDARKNERTDGQPDNLIPPAPNDSDDRVVQASPFFAHFGMLHLTCRTSLLL